jgi:pimeloyl-ACP methyl ester carboxylesterase
MFCRVPSAIEHRFVRTNGISLHIAEQGEGPLVVLCHGFPELWYSWRHQLPALAKAGYHAVAPDQRGYGQTDRPTAIEDYDVLHLTGDLLGLLDALDEEQAVFVGHDWGAVVAWQLALMAPERVAGVVGMSIPYVPRTPVPPIELLEAAFPDRFMYILYFQEPGRADRELGRDVRMTISRLFWTASGDAPPGSGWRLTRDAAGWLEGMSDPSDPPDWLTDEDLDYFVQEFSRTGFTGGLNWYRNLDRNWELTADLAGAKVEVPALFIAGERDTVLKMTPPEIMDGWVSDLRAKVLIPGAGHWVQQERPHAVNDELLRFLKAIEW